MSVNDKWHYCHNSDVLVGSRAMRDRHLQLLGYIILQVSCRRCESVSHVLISLETVVSSTVFKDACVSLHQLPYLELEKLNGIEEVKQYLHKKLLEVPL